MSDRTGLILPGRVIVIARQTFVQVMRMKVFYFLVVFAVLMLALLCVDFGSLTQVQDAEQSLRVMKGAAFFSMNVFATVFAIAATALLIPRDVEDRTLYTILSKPVTRLEYLFGRYLGVVLVLALGLLLMGLVFGVTLRYSIESVLGEQVAIMQQMGFSKELMAERETLLREHGFGLLLGVYSVFLKGLVLAAVALCISTFSTSTLFTLVATVVVMLLGLLVDEARSVMLEYAVAGRELGVLSIAHWVAYLFPDLKLMSLEDATIHGKRVPVGLVIRVTWLALLHVGISVVLSWFIFRKKEV